MIRLAHPDGRPGFVQQDAHDQWRVYLEGVTSIPAFALISEADDWIEMHGFAYEHSQPAGAGTASAQGGHQA